MRDAARNSKFFLTSILVVDEQERPPRFNDVSDFFEMKIPSANSVWRHLDNSMGMQEIRMKCRTRHFALNLTPRKVGGTTGGGGP